MDQQQKQRVKQNITKSQKANQASRFGKQGLTDKAAKMNSKNFSKMMNGRGLSKEKTKECLDSFQRSKNSPMMARHAKKGEKFTMTSGKQTASGIYLSKKSFGKTPEQRINKGALPPSNAATRQQSAYLGKDQNVVYGKVAAQKGFQKQDPKHLQRNGGGMQTVTNGGINSGAVQRGVKNAPKASDKAAAFRKSASQKHSMKQVAQRQAQKQTQSKSRSR